MKTSVIICNILTGGIIMNEFAYYSVDQFLKLAGGSVICIVGLLLLSKKQPLRNK